MASMSEVKQPAAEGADEGPGTAPVSLARIMVALDASDYADRGLEEAVRFARWTGGTVTGIHAYAAKLHDNRFRQMEGGLPERYRKEQEMERQRVVHDDLITRGLGIISDSYHDTAAGVCDGAKVPYRRLSPEGKNYRRIAEAVAGGEADLLVIGALGLGAIPGATVGTVCERVVRRAPIDVLVIRDLGRAIGDGPLVVGLDGSPRSFGSLKTALMLAWETGAEVHAVAAYDPYFHYVAFNKISGALSEEASKTFRFQDQEKLHEEIIDSGIARIYQSHLEIAQAVAGEEGAEITCELLDGKPYDAIARYLGHVGASLLLVGKTGIHADPELDIGGNAENLMRMSPCHVWLGQVTHRPALDTVARETITWTEEADAKMDRVPESARGMVRMAILRLAQESGHTVITSALIDEATARFCPERRGAPESNGGVPWSDEAVALLDKSGDPAFSTSIRLRAEKRARRASALEVGAEHVRPFLEESAAPAAVWNAAALARLARVPEMMRSAVRNRIEARARERGVNEITLDEAEDGIARSREAMEAAMHGGSKREESDPAEQGKASGCPFAGRHGLAGEVDDVPAGRSPFTWSPEAREKIGRIPEGFMRTLTCERVEVYAGRHGVTTITPELIDAKYAEWGEGSSRQKMTLAWEESAQARVDRIPHFIRGMVILEVERCAREMGCDRVTDAVIDRATGGWEGMGAFHSKMNPDLYKRPDKA